MTAPKILETSRVNRRTLLRNGKVYAVTISDGHVVKIVHFGDGGNFSNFPEDRCHKLWADAKAAIQAQG